MSNKRKKISLKDLRKHVVNTRNVKGGKIHTIQTPNAGNIEIVEGNQHSQGGVNYIKTSDGVTHEIENNEVVLPTDKGPYVVSDYMNLDGSKNYNKNKASYADLIKYLAMTGATKQELEAVAMQTEVQNGNDPNNPTSLIQDTNIAQQPKVNKYKQTSQEEWDDMDMMTKLTSVPPQTPFQYLMGSNKDGDENTSAFNYLRSEASKSNAPVITAGQPAVDALEDTNILQEPEENIKLYKDTSGNTALDNLLKLKQINALNYQQQYQLQPQPYLNPINSPNAYVQSPQYFGGGATADMSQSLSYKEPVKKYQQITDSKGNMLVPNRISYPNDNMFQRAGRYIGNKYLQLAGRDDEYYQEPEVKKYQQVEDRQSKSGKDNFWGNIFGNKRTEVQIGGDDVRLEDEGSNIYSQNLEYNIVDGDTTGVYQNLLTNQEVTRGSSDIVNTYEDDVLISSDTITNAPVTYRDVLKYDIKSGELVITDKAGNVHTNVTQVSEANKPSIFRTDLKGGNQVITNTTTNTPAWPYGNISLREVDGKHSLLNQESVNTFRSWMNDKYPDFKYKGESLDATGADNQYVQEALRVYGNEFSLDLEEGNYSRAMTGPNKGRFLTYPTQTTTSDTTDVSREEINKLLKIKYQQPHQYKGGGKLVRKYQTPAYETSFEGDVTNIPTDFKFDYDATLTPITSGDGSYTAMTDWTHKDDTTPNVQPTQAELNARGFQNFDQWRAWVNKQKGFEKYDWCKTQFWGPKHDEAWKAMSGPPTTTSTKKTIPGPCVGSGCDDGSTFSSNTTPNKKIVEDGDGGTKIPWKGIGIAALGAGAIYGLSKLGGGNEAIDHAMKQKPNLIPHVNLGEARLQLMNNQNELAMLDRERWTALQKLKKGYNPSGTYIAKEYEISDDISAKKSKSFAELNEINTKIGNQEANLNVQLDMKQGDINAKIDVANQLERRDIREQQIAALDAKYNRRQQLISDLIKLGGQGIEAYATAKSKSTPLTKSSS